MPLGAVLTGPIGAGKSTLAKSLSTQLQMEIIPSVGTRKADSSDEGEFIHCDTAAFHDGAREGRVVMPCFFVGNWYGYRREDWDRVIAASGAGFVFNVRPYTGLVLASALSRVAAIWIDLSPETRRSRLMRRGAERDANLSSRETADEEEAVYRDVYPYAIDGSDTGRALDEIASILRHGQPFRSKPS